MHATIQKPLDEILRYFGEGQKVLVVGCGNCAAKARSGGEPETKAMAERLRAAGVEVTGWAVPPNGGSLCKLSDTRHLLNVEHAGAVEAADCFLILACGQGLHTVIDATEGGEAYPGCDTVFGGETVSDGLIVEYCSLCGECIVHLTGGLCPITLCAKGLTNGPCGGASNGKCEVDPERDCGWHLIYERASALGKLDLLRRFVPPRDNSRAVKPRRLVLEGKRATFHFAAKTVSSWPGAEPEDNERKGGE